MWEDNILYFLIIWIVLNVENIEYYNSNNRLRNLQALWVSKPFKDHDYFT